MEGGVRVVMGDLEFSGRWHSVHGRSVDDFGTVAWYGTEETRVHTFTWSLSESLFSSRLRV